ncbi:MAG: methionyl-tRNA synthetase [Parcubacteria group bacterium LiPW_15]|nr:MAG: methionyl-tRNA synthetase [Parcubacteria group bacterium LiPW_15]
MAPKKFYLTTTLPYVNAAPHIGFALEIVQADIICRYNKLLGESVVFNTGTDEHGAKIYEKAKEEGKDPQAYVDEYAAKFKLLKDALNLDYTNFIRTTDPHHISAAQEFWKLCDKNGYIYKGSYKIKYCVGCELEKTESELVDGKCPIHPNLTIQEIEEENYFFKFSEFQQKLLDLYEKIPDFVLPAHRLTEIKNFVTEGPKDFSISRLASKMPWGIPVPGDEAQVMYVWFDALINYISTLGWPEEEKNFADFWGTLGEPNAIQIAGKDNLRQQSSMWQAMLMAAGLPTSRQILIHGFITSGGEKMSKSLGNVVDPLTIAKEYGADALRYWLAREMPTFEDGDFTLEKFKDAYNANLANGLGNLASRVMKMASTNGVRYDASINIAEAEDTRGVFAGAMKDFEIKAAVDSVWSLISWADGYIQKEEPFKKIKTDKGAAEKDIQKLISALKTIAELLEPVLPVACEKILSAIKNGTEVSPLFPRIA